MTLRSDGLNSIGNRVGRVETDGNYRDLHRMCTVFINHFSTRLGQTLARRSSAFGIKSVALPRKTLKGPRPEVSRGWNVAQARYRHAAPVDAAQRGQRTRVSVGPLQQPRTDVDLGLSTE